MEKIDSLEDLRKAQRELALKKEVTLRAFSNKLQVVRRDTSGYVLKKIILPVGIGAIAAFAIKAFLDAQKNKEEKASTEEANLKVVKEVTTKQSSLQWLNYFNILLSFFKIFQQVVAKKANAEEHGDSIQETDSETEKNAILTPRELARNYRRQQVTQD